MVLFFYHEDFSATQVDSYGRKKVLCASAAIWTMIYSVLQPVRSEAEIYKVRTDLAWLACRLGRRHLQSTHLCSVPCPHSQQKHLQTPYRTCVPRLHARTSHTTKPATFRVASLERSSTSLYGFRFFPVWPARQIGSETLRISHRSGVYRLHTRSR